MNATAATLASYMSELSEQAYCAGWMLDLEFDLWRAVTEGPFRYGRLELSAEHIDRLRSLSQACGGWIRFGDDWEFVPLADWQALYACRHNA